MATIAEIKAEILRLNPNQKGLTGKSKAQLQAILDGLKPAPPPPRPRTRTPPAPRPQTPPPPAPAPASPARGDMTRADKQKLVDEICGLMTKLYVR